MTDPGDGAPQLDLLSGISDLDAISHLLADLHDDLPGKVARLRHIADLASAFGSEGTMLFGGSVVFSAWVEARWSFIHGNFAATILLCQSLVENLLAAFLHVGVMMDNLPQRVTFRDTLKYCRAHNVISSQDSDDLEQLMNLRNPLSHFRTTEDGQNLDSRAMTTGLRPEALIQQDASFAIGLAVRMLSKPQFRLG